MGRTPEYDRDEALAAAAALFGSVGYQGCSVDDLVKALGIHRGSLYKAFGSKRGLFVEALRAYVDGPVRHLTGQLAGGPTPPVTGAALAAGSEDLDLLLVAAMEASADPVVRSIFASALTSLGHGFGKADGIECPDVEARSAGLLLLTGRLAGRSLPADELPQHLGRFWALLH